MVKEIFIFKINNNKWNSLSEIVSKKIVNNDGFIFYNEIY